MLSFYFGNDFKPNHKQIHMNKYKIGDKLNEGIVFFIDASNEHGMIVSPQDLTGTADWDEAVQICIDYRAGGFDDWRLPTIEELNMVFENKNQIGNFTSFSYWSSTQYAEHFAWFKNFVNGLQDNDFKDNTCYVRAIRSF